MMAGIIWHPKIDTVDQHNHKPCKIRRLENLPQRTWILTVCTRYSSWTDGHNFYSTKNKKTSSQLVTAAKARLRSRKLLGDGKKGQKHSAARVKRTLRQRSAVHAVRKLTNLTTKLEKEYQEFDMHMRQSRE